MSSRDQEIEPISLKEKSYEELTNKNYETSQESQSLIKRKSTEKLPYYRNGNKRGK